MKKDRVLEPHQISNNIMVEADSFLHLARPLGPAIVGSQPTTAPLNVIIQPQVGSSFL